MKFKIASLIRALLLLFAVGAAMEMALPQTAEARAGRSRSSGRVYRQPATPPPGSSNFNRNPYTNPQQQQPMMNNNRGGFMRGLAGGLAGGFLGSMLFSSLGHAAGGSGAGGFGGGIGFFEILLLAGAGYLLYRWWKNRQQQQQPAFAGMNRSYEPETTTNYGSPSAFPAAASQFRALAPEGIGSDEASDIFFKVQGAWTRRDLTSVRELLGAEIQQTFERDIEDLKQQKLINRLENISIRRTEVIGSWNEDGQDLTTVRFTANLLDYTADEQSGRVIEGSDSNPVKFEEDWTFAKSSTNGWKLVGIQQV